MQTYEQKFFDNENALRREIAEVLESAEGGDTDAIAKLAEINKQISYEVDYKANVSLKYECEKLYNK